jgi:hypothetical protein
MLFGFAARPRPASLLSRLLPAGLLVVLAAGTAAAAVPWPKNEPEPPVTFASPQALKAVQVDGLLKAGELASGWMNNPRVRVAFKALSVAPELAEARQAWNESEFGVTVERLVVAMVKLGCPLVDATHFAASTVAAGMLAGKDAVNREQMDAIFRSYKNARGGADDVWGAEQGFLGGSTRQLLRSRYPQLDEKRLDELEDLSLRTYCENRLYREQWTAYKEQVRQWLREQHVAWSGFDASLEKLIQGMSALEARIEAKHAESGLFDPERKKLIEALLRGGPKGVDAALAGYFSRYFRDERNARGDKLGPGPAGAAAAPAVPEPAKPGTFKNTFEFQVPESRRWQVGQWQVEHANPIYQTGEIYLAGKAMASWNLADGGEAKLVRSFVVDVPPGTSVEVKITVPKAGPSSTMAQTVSTGDKARRWAVQWFVDSLHCQPID